MFIRPFTQDFQAGPAVGQASLCPRTRNQARAALLELTCRGDTQQQPRESRTQKEARVSSRTPPCGCAHPPNQLARQGHGGRRLWRWEQPQSQVPLRPWLMSEWSPLRLSLYLCRGPSPPPQSCPLCTRGVAMLADPPDK